jgi:F0F1-type ATP synthase assembly protein I
MKKDNRQVAETLVLVFQFGINMIVPIFLCSMIGIWLGERTGISWMMIPFFIVGALAGFTNIYKMVKKRLK